MKPLVAIAPTNNDGRLRLANGEDFLIYALPDGATWALVQLDTATSWTATAVITVQVGLTLDKQHNFATGAVTYSAVGLQEILSVKGCLYLKLYVSTAAAGTDVITPTVTAGRDY